MKAIHHIALLGCLWVSCSSCYQLYFALDDRQATTAYSQDRATKEEKLFICPTREFVYIHYSVLKGLEWKEPYKEATSAPITWKLTAVHPNGNEHVLANGMNSGDVHSPLRVPILGYPEGNTRFSLKIYDAGQWIEKEYAIIPIKSEPDPISVQLRPNGYSEADTRYQSWEGLYPEDNDVQSLRSPSVVIADVQVGGLPNFDAYEVQFSGDSFYNTNTPGIYETVGVIEAGAFRPTSNIVKPYPRGWWKIVPISTASRSWSRYDWERVSSLSLTVLYKCG